MTQILQRDFDQFGHVPRRTLPPLQLRCLDNGLTVAVLDAPSCPVVATALAYRAGGRDDLPDRGGTAHFLEHMMFKGSSRFAAGEVDRRTLALGGSVNAATSHDLTIYCFNLPADRWQLALDVESDRMAGLTLDDDEVDRERQVVLEEIGMYESDPWHGLSRAVREAAFGTHPYGRPLLGTPGELKAIGADELRSFHEAWYRPDNAFLVLAGDVGDEPFARVRDAFGEHQGKSALPLRRQEPLRWPSTLRCLDRRVGEAARIFLALPEPPATDADHAAMRLLTAVLVQGRASRLHRALVDERQLCGEVSGGLREAVDGGSLDIALEVLPEVDPALAGDVLLNELERLAVQPPDDAEVERAKRMLLSEWLFSHQQSHQQAWSLAAHLALWDDVAPWRVLARTLALHAEDLPPVIQRYLRPGSGGVLCCSRPGGSERG